MYKFLVLAMLLAFLAAPVHAQNVVGDWQGTLKAAGGVELPTILHVRRSPAGTLTASLDSPSQHAFGIPISAIALEGAKLSFTSAAVDGAYEGVVASDGKSIRGTWTQRGASLPLDFQRLPSSDIEGVWTGALQIGTTKLGLIFHLANTEQGLVGSLDVPQQGARGIPLSAVTRNGSAVTIEVGTIGGKFAGTTDTAHAEIKGTWTQNGMSLPLDLKREENLSATEGSGQPEGAGGLSPAKILTGVREIPVSIPTPTGSLAGSLTEPLHFAPAAKLPAALIIAGSGPTDRNGNNPLENPERYLYLRLAAYLSRNGVVVLRYDKRGIAGSAKAAAPKSFEQFALDVGSAVELLARQPNVDPRRITLIGHSEGSALAFWDAATDKRVSRIVSLEGMGRTGAQVLTWQLTEAVERVPAALQAQAQANLRTQETVVGLISAGKPVPPAMVEGNPLLISLASQAPIARGFLNLNPIDYARRVRVPTLIVQGGKDIQVTPDLDARPLYQAVPSSVSRRLAVFPDMIHLLYDVSDPAGPANYLVPANAPLDTGMERAVLDWVTGSREGMKPSSGGTAR